MKKILKCLLFVSVLGMAVACGTKNSSEQKPTSDTGSHEPTQEELDDGRELIENELYTDSGFRIEFDAVGAKIKKMYYELVLDLPIRSLGVSFFDIRKIENRQMNLFYIENEKQIVLNKCINDIHNKFGKNSIIPGMSILKSSTMRYRNKCIGGHNGQ